MFLPHAPMIVVHDDGTWIYVPRHEVILWYDWNGEYHPLYNIQDVAEYSIRPIQ